MLADAAKSAPPGVKIDPIYDQGLLVRTAIANVRDAIVIGGCLSVLVLLLFLKSWRATLIASLAIPLSLVISFVFLYLTGDTLNLMSLGGLAVAIGLIIDDTVVVVENIARHLAEGQSGRRGGRSASREISGAVIGSTLTTILVFLPLALVSGVVGQFFQSLSIVADRGLVGLDGGQPDDHSGAGRPLPGAPADADDRPDLQSAGRSLRRAAAAGAASSRSDGAARRCWPSFRAGCCSITWRPASCPRWTKGRLVIDYHMPVGTSLAQTDKVLRRVEAVLLRDAGYFGLHPPDRGRARFFRHRVLHRRHPRQPQAARPAPAGRRDL